MGTSIFKNALRKLVPEFLLQERENIRRLGPVAGRIYAGLRLRDVVGVREMNQRFVPPSTRSFVFVCFGNIMRSAMAEFLMRKTLRDAAPDAIEGIHIVSAGLHARPGSETHPWAQEAAGELGVSMVTHRSKLLTRKMVDEADAILAMDFQNKAELLTSYPDAAEKIYMLSAYAEGAWKNREIPDPYLGNPDATRYCARQIETCVGNLLASTIFAGREPAATSYEEPLTHN